MVEEASRHFPCTVVHFAAVFSDWCEYEPLYSMLCRWLSHRWDARIMPGRGEMAIQLAIDEIEETYNRLDGRPHCTSARRPVTTPSEVTSRNP